MSVAVIYNDREIKQVQYRTADPSRFTVLDKKIRRLGKYVEENWDKLSVEDRNELKNLAYELIEVPKGIQKLVSCVRAWICLTFYVTTDEQKRELHSCSEALDILVDNILNAIEREEPSYQQVFLDTLEELNSNWGLGEPVDGNRKGECL